MEKTDIKKEKKFKGTVVSNKTDKTVVVSVGRFVKHPKYGKFYTISKNYTAHDPENRTEVGEKVEIRETKPISKRKRFEVIYK
jgi:small subunit ribosomal protein S17